MTAGVLRVMTPFSPNHSLSVPSAALSEYSLPVVDPNTLEGGRGRSLHQQQLPRPKRVSRLIPPLCCSPAMPLHGGCCVGGMIVDGDSLSNRSGAFSFVHGHSLKLSGFRPHRRDIVDTPPHGRSW